MNTFQMYTSIRYFSIEVQDVLDKKRVINY